MAEKKEKRYVSDNAQLMAEWDWEKNNELGYDPHKISYGSAIKVCWLCANGHHWEATPNQRARNNCPYCSNQKILTGYNDFATLRPDLLKEWDYENNALDPTKISAGTHKKARWKCSICGHMWSSEIVARAKSNQGCPVCKKDKISKRVHQHYLHTNGSLMKTHPELAAEWHPTKNTKKASDVVAGSDNKAWWLGPCGHEWKAIINSRVKGNKCPYCSNQKVLPGYNDLESQFPELLNEWDYNKNTLVPAQIVATTDKRAWWICHVCGYNWHTQISQRTRLGRGCPQCGKHSAQNTRRQQLVDANGSLMDTHPQLAAEWHPTKNTLSVNQVTHGSNLKAWWLCPLGHEYQAVISSRAIIGSGCPVCVNKQVLRGYNDLASQFPEIAHEWHIKNKIKPDEVMATSGKKFWWQCRVCGYEYYKSVELRTKYHHHCPKCNTQRSIAETIICYYLSEVNEQYIQSFRPDWMSGKEIDVFLPQHNLAIEYDGMLYHQNFKRDISKSNFLKAIGITLLRIREKGCPELPTTDVIFERSNPEDYSSLTKTLLDVFIWLNQTYNISLPDINVEQDLQKVMVIRAKQQKERSIALLRPNLLLEWDYERNVVSPELVSVGSDIKIHWKCQTCNHRWQSVASSRTQPNGVGCPVCAGRVVLPGYNDLATHCPELIKQWSDRNTISPTEITAGSSRKVWWKCDKGHEWQATISSRNVGGCGCPYCSGRLAIKGENDLQTVNPTLASEWNYEKNYSLTPELILPKSGKKVWWKCNTCGHEWEARVVKRTLGNNCPECAKQKRKKKDT